MGPQDIVMGKVQTNTPLHKGKKRAKTQFRRLSDVEAGRARQRPSPIMRCDIYVSKRRDVPCCVAPARAVWREGTPRPSEPYPTFDAQREAFTSLTKD